VGLAQPAWLLLPLAVLLSAGLGWLLIPLAVKLRWVDEPGEHKAHEGATPPAGGLAIFIALATAAGMLLNTELPMEKFFLPLLAGGCVLLITGLVDDLRGLSPTLRFLVQIGVCLLLIHFTGVRLVDFGQLFSNKLLQLGWLAVPITIFSALGVINAFNLIDGLDGLSGGIFLVAAAGMALFAWLAGQEASLWLLLLSMAAVAGFMLLNARLPWNRNARIFLGDSGSLLLGLLLAWSFIRLGSGVDRAFMPMTAVWLFAVPLLDATTLIRRRWSAGRSAFSADRNHLHHAFLRAGYSVREAWTAIMLLALALAVFGIGFELSDLPEWLSFYTFMAVAFVYYFYMKHSWAAQCFLGRHFIYQDLLVEEG